MSLSDEEPFVGDRPASVAPPAELAPQNESTPPTDATPSTDTSASGEHQPSTRRVTRRQVVVATASLGTVGLAAWWAGRRPRPELQVPATPTASPVSPPHREPDFFDDFTAASTIDSRGTGAAGFKWYTDLPFSWGQVAPDEYSVADSVLTLHPTTDRANWTLATTSAATGNGTSFSHGYFAARLRFGKPRVIRDMSWPAFWSLSTAHVTGQTGTRYAELDFFEAMGSPDAPTFYGTLHGREQSAGNVTDHSQTSSNAAPLHASLADWHEYSCRWTQGRVDWFFDGIPVLHHEYSTKGTGREQQLFSSIDEESRGMTVILGTGSGWPLDVDWVKIWDEGASRPGPSASARSNR